MNRYEFLIQYENACKIFYKYLYTFIEQHIDEYKKLLDGNVTKLWEKKYSAYDGTFFGGIATITIDGSKSMPNSIFKYHQVLYGPIISRELYFRLMKNKQISTVDILHDIVVNHMKYNLGIDEYNKFRYNQIYKFIGLKELVFKQLQHEFIKKGFFLINETNDNDVSIRLKIYSYKPYAKKQKEVLWHGQNYIPT